MWAYLCCNFTILDFFDRFQCKINICCKMFDVVKCLLLKDDTENSETFTPVKGEKELNLIFFIFCIS